MSNTIAQTILAQLGGNRFLAMTGAKDLVNTGKGLQFAIGRGASNKANKVVVTLTDADLTDADLYDADLYDVRFLTIRGVNMTERGTVEGVHADRLAAVFTEQTGFDTHM